MQPEKKIKHILISRADSIGDVVLTLPMAGVLKALHPGVKISFLGKNYTKDVIALSEHVDEFISYDELTPMEVSGQIKLLRAKKIDCAIHVFPKQDLSILFKKALIPIRVGTTNRMYHWFHCTKLIKLSRKNSLLHEAQLNLKLIEFLGAKPEYSLAEIESFYGFTKVPALEKQFTDLIDPAKENIILHPKSKGSAREWGLENFDRLIKQLPSDKFKIFISGTKEEGELAAELFRKNKDLINLTGRMNLNQFIAFINTADGLIAASTGPLHIAAALGKKALGLFAPMRPIHPGRWMPVGKRAGHVVMEKNCNACRSTPQNCECMKGISVNEVMERYSKL